MRDLILNPASALVIYLLLSGVVYSLGRWMAPVAPTEMKSSTYASGEAAPKHQVGPGYRPYFVVALFFAILHLGILVLGSGGFTAISLVYLLGIMMALLALILG
jgi:NADH:ubiquinone oxidoreductase subunit 3 (subunit A)